MVAVGNAHGLGGFLGWRRGATYDREGRRRRIEGFMRALRANDSGVAPRRTRNPHRVQGLKPLATIVPSLRDRTGFTISQDDTSRPREIAEMLERFRRGGIRAS
jgi:hypothetical protein